MYKKDNLCEEKTNDSRNPNNTTSHSILNTNIKIKGSHSRTQSEKNFDTDFELTDNANETPPGLKRHRIRADTAKCFLYAKTDLSAQVLTTPLLNTEFHRPHTTDLNRGLYPRIRLRKRSLKKPQYCQNAPDNKTTEHDNSLVLPSKSNAKTNSSNRPVVVSSLGGIRTASDVYNNLNFVKKCDHGSQNQQQNIKVLQKNVCKSFSTGKAKEKIVKKHKTQKNQTCITNFFTSTLSKTKLKIMADDEELMADDEELMAELMADDEELMADDEELMPIMQEAMFENEAKTETNFLPTTPSKMFSPIKHMSTSVYSIITPVKEKVVGLEEDKSQNIAVKRLFDEQNKKSLKYGKRKSEQKSFKNKSVLMSKKFISPMIVDFMNSDDNDFQDVGIGMKVNKAFGLVETSELLDIKPSPYICDTNYFETLPFEVLESIFCQLPVLDLCLNCNRVCKQWNSIISFDKFLPWKKQYYKQLVEEPGSINVAQVLGTAQMLPPSQFLKSFIKYMKNFKSITYIGVNMTECLSSHPKYTWACELIKDGIADCIKDEMVNPWSIIACLVVISESVKDVKMILDCLLKTSSQCSIKDVLECFYCMATLLNAMMKRLPPSVWNHLHYRVFYSLYLFENMSVSDHGMLQEAIKGVNGQQTMIKYGTGNTNVRLTHEQLRIIKYHPREQETIKIVAFAGTGKTTTLVRYTQLRPNLKFLLIFYNKSVCEIAKTKFPSNVTIKTCHGLAFGITGRRYKAANKLNSWGLKVYNVAVELPSRKGENLFVRAKFVLETLNNFLASPDHTVTTEHAPSFFRNDNGVLQTVDGTAKLLYAEDASYFWERMKNLNDNAIGMTHDGYLKLYQLEAPILYGYDIILIDEAQDLTPAIIEILKQQKLTKIIVGDPHQQIYSFRGAVNAMQQIESTKTFYLTQSFRFGPEIAHIASCCLHLLKNVTQKTIVGHDRPGKITGESVGQIAIISRCNFTLFAEAVKKCCFNSNEVQTVAFVGGTEGFGFPIIQDICTLMMSADNRTKDNRRIENKFVASFSNIGELEKYANKTLDHELLGKIKIVRTFNHSLPSHINKILHKAVKDISVADIVFSTAHKSKGLEFSTVKITDDFTYLGPGSSFNIGPGPIPYDESNLLYVAVTRATNALQMSPDIVKILKESGMKFETPVLSKVLKDENVSFTCHLTGATFTPKVLTIQKQTIKLGCGTVLTGGLISPQFLYEDSHPFKELLGQKPACNTTSLPLNVNY